MSSNIFAKLAVRSRVKLYQLFSQRGPLYLLLFKYIFVLFVLVFLLAILIHHQSVDLIVGTLDMDESESIQPFKPKNEFIKILYEVSLRLLFL